MTTTASELRNMQTADLEREVTGKRMLIAKMHIGIELRQEKDTARLRREKKELARMLTILRGQQQGAKHAVPGLKEAQETARVRAPRRKLPSILS